MSCANCDRLWDELRDEEKLKFKAEAERDSYREDALRYRALRDSGRYCPDPFGNGWALSMNHGTPTDELDAAADGIRPK